MEGEHKEQLPTPETTGVIRPQAEQEPEIVPRIYVASLSDYNAGRLHGAWIDAAQEPEDLQLHINAMLSKSKETIAEEWAIHDFENFNGLHLGEWEDLTHVSRVAKGITEHGLAFAHFATIAASDDELDQFDDAYQGHWDSLTAYADNMLDDFGIERALDSAVPESLRPYVRFDSEAFGRDLELGGDITAIEGDGAVYVFHSL